MKSSIVFYSSYLICKLFFDKTELLQREEEKKKKWIQHQNLLYLRKKVKIPKNRTITSYISQVCDFSFTFFKFRSFCCEYFWFASCCSLFIRQNLKFRRKRLAQDIETKTNHISSSSSLPRRHNKKKRSRRRH